MSNKEKFIARKKQAIADNLEAHVRDVLSGVKVKLTDNIYIKK